MSISQEQDTFTSTDVYTYRRSMTVSIDGGLSLSSAYMRAVQCAGETYGSLHTRLRCMLHTFKANQACLHQALMQQATSRATCCASSSCSGSPPAWTPTTCTSTASRASSRLPQCEPPHCSSLLASYFLHVRSPCLVLHLTRPGMATRAGRCEASCMAAAGPLDAVQALVHGVRRTALLRILPGVRFPATSPACFTSKPPLFGAFSVVLGTRSAGLQACTGGGCTHSCSAVIAVQCQPSQILNLAVHAAQGRNESGDADPNFAQYLDYNSSDATNAELRLAIFNFQPAKTINAQLDLCLVRSSFCLVLPVCSYSCVQILHRTCSRLVVLAGTLRPVFGCMHACNERLSLLPDALLRMLYLHTAAGAGRLVGSHCVDLHQ